MSYIFDGYTDKVSYNIGDIVIVYANAIKNVENITIKIINMLRKPVLEIPVKRLFNQIVKHDGIIKVIPTYTGNKTVLDPWKDYQYRESFRFTIPLNFASGVYIIGNKIKFIVKSNTHKPIMILYPSNTECAYNIMGGKNLYFSILGGKKDELRRSIIVGFRRPSFAKNPVDRHSYGFLKWIAGNSLNKDCGYICDFDMDNYANISKAKLLIIIGHSEYWSFKARLNVTKYLESGHNLLNLSGNTMWWHIEYLDHGTKIVCVKHHEIRSLLFGNDVAIFDKYRDTIKFSELLHPFSKHYKTHMNNCVQYHTYKYNDGIVCCPKCNEPAYDAYYDIGMTFLAGGYGSLKEMFSTWDNKYYMYNKSILFDNMPSITSLSIPTVEHDGFYINVVDQKEIEGYVMSWRLPKFDFYLDQHGKFLTKNLVDKKKSVGDKTIINHLKNTIKINPKMYNCFKYKKVIMLGPTYNVVNSSVNTIRFTGIICIKKSDLHGIVLSTGSMSWCSEFVFSGKDGDSIKKLTENAIRILMSSACNNLLK